jgi:dextranase
MTFTGGINTEVKFVKENCLFTPNQQLNSVWTIIKEMPGYMVMHAINLYGLDNDVWHAGKKAAPPTLTEIVITVEVLEEIEGLFWASPDSQSIQANSLPYKWVSRDDNSGKCIQFTLPRLDYWSMVCLKTRHGAAVGNCGGDDQEMKDV